MAKVAVNSNTAGYRATLRTNAGRLIWAASGVAAQAARNTLIADVLTNGQRDAGALEETARALREAYSVFSQEKNNG